MAKGSVGRRRTCLEKNFIVIAALTTGFVLVHPRPVDATLLGETAGIGDTPDPTDVKHRFLREDNDFYQSEDEDDDYEDEDEEDEYKDDDPYRHTEAPTPDPIWKDLDDYEWMFENYHGDYGLNNVIFADDFENRDTELLSSYNVDALSYRPRNSVVLNISAGVVHYELLTHIEKNRMTRRLLKTMSVVLNKYETETGLGLPVVVTDRDFLGKEPIERETEHRDSVGNKGSLGGINITHYIPKVSDRHLVKMVLHNITVHTYDWLEMTVIYTVQRKRRKDIVELPEEDNDTGEEDSPSNIRAYMSNFNKPVNRRKIRTKIEHICQYALEDSIDTGLFWDTLGMVFSRGHKSMHLILGKTPYMPYAKGIGAVRAPGHEYSLKQHYCPDQIPVDCGHCCPPPMVSGDVPAWVDPNNENQQSMESNYQHPNGTYVYPIADSPLEVEWSIREWVGLGMMSFTTVLVVVLSLVAHFVSERRNSQRLWGAALTSEGVEEMLQVGWRFRQGPPTAGDDPRTQQQQELQREFYLQVFDKGRGPGYNDENSLLKGGIERERNGARGGTPVSTTAPTSSANTNHQRHDFAGCDVPPRSYGGPQQATPKKPTS